MKDVWKNWGPMSASVTPSGALFTVTGREYRFEESVFPVSVKIGSEEFLSGPIELVASYNGVTECRLAEYSAYELENGEEKAVFQFASKMGNTVIDGRISCEFDGCMEICFSMIPFWSFSPDNLNKPQLDKLYIDIPVKKELARLYHYWPNDVTSIIPNARVVNADAIPTSGIALPFKPYLWIGNEFSGLGVTMESDDPIECGDVQSEYIVKNDEVILRVHLLDHMPADWQDRRDRWIDAVNPIDYRIGLMATPSKTVDPSLKKNWRVYHAFGNMYVNCKPGEKPHPAYLNELPGAMEKLEKAGVKWVIFHESSSRAQNYGLIEDETRFRALIDACHAHNMKTMLYFGYEFSTLAPTWYEKAKDYLINTTDGHFTGGWQRNPPQRAFMVCYHGGYSDDMIERVKYVMDNFGVDGIYTDGTYVPWECANARHGCGYTDRFGKRHTTFPVFAVREHVKKLYEVVHERGGLIDTHQSTCCIAPTLSFCDTYYDGENIQGALIESVRSGRGLLDFLNLPAFRTEYMGKNLGLIDQFISYSNPELGWTIEKLAALTLIHDVMPRPRQKGELSDESLTVDLDYMSKIWRVWDEFEAVEAEWLPYWKDNDLIACETENAFLSLYRGPKKTLGVLSNLSMKPVTVTLRTHLTSMRNILTGEVYPAENGVVSIDMPPCSPYLLYI